MFDHKRPQAAGLYDPAFEHDACGIGAVARLDNRREHEVVERAIDVLLRLEHRGAVGSEIDTGDGAGILFQVPDEFFRATACSTSSCRGPLRRRLLLPDDDDARRAEPRRWSTQGRRRRGPGAARLARRPGRRVDVPGPSAAEAMPVVRQVFVGSTLPDDADEMAFERKLYVIRRVIEDQAEPT